MKYILTIFIISSCTFFSKAQTLKIEKGASTMEVQGTSSLHDWKSTVEEFTVEAILKEDQINNIQFSAIVKSIKSGKSGMDGNTYKALKEDKYPEIKFVSSQLNILKDRLIGTGQLTIAGKSKDIPINLIIKQNTTTTVNGNVKIKMTDYDITPPTAVFGTIKTGDEITIQFNFTLIKS
ncbi:Polyisoprenoid-binding protein YceI [Reichenbachiella faecimaris]|uniref:Polyisoprenoid-binding protein YceI n=1 Tax=Reichenbachiella faecimaris TaxID=692418 RepID=A0A1W2GKS4_REIFA|nr:YceI family protein [Reichenbachiella faecimaris]SMD36866.1 Polyisoprenoid-binding protein YceI [Reichenbachiella faecimaris]